MRISELSRRTGVSVRSLRYYEGKHLITSQRLENGYRIFDESAVERVHAIQLYFGLGLNTVQIEKIFKCSGEPILSEKSPICPSVLSLYEHKLDEITEQLEILQNVKEQLEERISFLKIVKHPTLIF